MFAHRHNLFLAARNEVPPHDDFFFERCTAQKQANKIFGRRDFEIA